MTFRSKKWFYEYNGNKGGRPKQDSKIYVEIPEIAPVILTQSQYNMLIKKFGSEITQKAVEVLREWFLSGSSYAEKYIGKNNYAHFRSDGWVINSTKLKP